MRYRIQYDSEEENSASTGAISVLLMSFIALILIYFWLFCLALKRCITVFRNKEGIKIGRWLFVIVNISIFMRVSSFVVLSYVIINNDDVPLDTKKTDFIYEYFVSTFYLPDLLFVICFGVLSWILFMVFQLSTINAESFRNMETRFRNKYFLIWLISIFLLSISQTVTFLYFWLQGQNAQECSWTFILENSIMNLIGPIYVISVEIYYHFAYSGIPYISKIKEERLKGMNGIILIWSFGRIIDGTVGIIEFIHKSMVMDALINYLRKNDPSLVEILIFPAIFLVYIFICECIPLALILDSKKMELFLIQSEISNTALMKGLTEEEGISDTSDPKQYKNDGISLHNNNLKPNGGVEGPSSSDSISQTGSQYNPKLIMVKEKNIWIDKETIIEYKPEGKLGLIKKAVVNGEILIARITTLSKVTPYLIEDMNKEIPKLNSLENLNVVKIRGFYTDGNSMVILYDHSENGSLHNLLHKKSKEDKNNDNSESPKLNGDFKEKIVFQLALAIDFLHKQNPPIIHGQLTPHNILFDSNYNPKITDYGLTSLKKLASVMLGYSNISQYTAPELLQERPKTIIATSPSADIYSFGILLWELYTEQEPFEGLSLKDIYKVVCKDNSRPKMPDDLPLGLQNLIRACWQQDPSKRPTMDDIISLLRRSLSEQQVGI